MAPFDRNPWHGHTEIATGSNRLEKLSKQGAPLERLNQVIHWDYFRETVEKILPNKMVNSGSPAIL